MRFIVTGSNGFIGYHTCERLIRLGYEVIGVDDLSTGLPTNKVDGVTYHVHTVLDNDWLQSLLRALQPNAVIHLAAIPRVGFSVDRPLESAMANLIGTISVLNSLRDADLSRGTRLVCASSSSVYGDVDTMPISETCACDPKSPYALSKAQAESWCSMFHRLYGLDVVSLRYFNVFGPRARFGGAYSTVLCAWLYHLSVDPSYQPFLEGDGTQSRDFCSVENIVQANISAATRTRAFSADVYNIAQGTSHSLLSVKAALERISGRELVLESRPPRLGDIRHTLADISRARNELHYDPDTDFEAQLHRMAGWYRNDYS